MASDDAPAGGDSHVTRIYRDGWVLVITQDGDGQVLAARWEQEDGAAIDPRVKRPPNGAGLGPVSSAERRPM